MITDNCSGNRVNLKQATVMAHTDDLCVCQYAHTFSLKRLLQPVADCWVFLRQQSRAGYQRDLRPKAHKRLG